MKYNMQFLSGVISILLSLVFEVVGLLYILFGIVNSNNQDCFLGLAFLVVSNIYSLVVDYRIDNKWFK